MKYAAPFTVALLAAALAGCSREVAQEAPAPKITETSVAPFLTLAPNAEGIVNVPLASVTDKALFINVPKEGTPTVQLIAIRDGSGQARIAFNT